MPSPGAQDSSEDFGSERGCAFAELFEQAYPRLWGLASALLGDRTEAEDLVQEAALVALRKFADFQRGTNFAAWMAQIVRMHAMNWRRKQRVRRTNATDPVEMDESGGQDALLQPMSATQAARGKFDDLRESLDQELVRELQQFDPPRRACLLLRVVHELSYEEISALVGVPVGTAMSHVHRTKRRLREQLPTTLKEG